MRKKKKTQKIIEYSELSQKYFEEWLKLEKCRDEKDFDNVRSTLNNLWAQMSSIDKQNFNLLSSKR